MLLGLFRTKGPNSCRHFPFSFSDFVIRGCAQSRAAPFAAVVNCRKQALALKTLTRRLSPLTGGWCNGYLSGLPVALISVPAIRVKGRFVMRLHFVLCTSAFLILTVVASAAQS